MPEAVVEQYRACTRKVRHNDQAAAQRVAESQRRRDGVAVLCAYKCQYCDGWHVGHPMKRIYEPDLEW